MIYHICMQDMLEHVISLVQKQKYTSKVEDLSRPKNRLDLELPPRGYCWEVLNRILAAWKKDKRSPWHQFKRRGVEPQIVEFSVLGSTPGSRNQLWHKDHGGAYGDLVSFGIPLIDVQDEHGPTECIPKRAEPNEIQAQTVSNSSAKRATLRVGRRNDPPGHRKQQQLHSPYIYVLTKKLPTSKDKLSLHPDLRQRLR